MDQGSNYIRQDIDDTRTALSEKVDTLQDKARETIETVQTKARQAFDINTQVAERPWIALGAAVAVGYVLGSLGGSDDDTRYSPPSNARYEKSDDNGYRYSPSAPSQPSASSEYRYTPGQSNYSASQAQQPAQSQRQSDQSGGVGNFLGQFDDEIESLKVAAIGTIRELLHNTLREYVPAMGKQLDQMQPSSSTSSSSGMGRSSTPVTPSTPSPERYTTPTTNQYS